MIHIQWEIIWSSLVVLIPRLIAAVIIFLAFWFLAIVVRKIINRFAQRRNLDPDVTNILDQVAMALFLILGAISALGTIGINMAATVASLGLVGFAVGFALRDALSNLLSGLMILVYKPFRRGDRISITGYEGSVMEINLRYTVIHAETGTVLIPNQNLFNNAVTVLSEGSTLTAK